MTIPKRTIEETRVRLKRERTIREIYVEGRFDRDLIKWALDQLNLSDIRVYPISTLDIPKETLEKYLLTSGERQRVIAAASELKDEKEIHPQILFLIDSDVDYLLDRANYHPPLIGTDGTSTELIFWKKGVLRKFLSLGLGCENSEKFAEEIMTFVEPIVSQVCLLRAAKEKLGTQWLLIDIEKSFDRKESFSFENYCSKVSNKNGIQQKTIGQLNKVLDELREKAKALSMPRQLHGHDLIATLAQKLRLDGYRQRCLNDFDELGRLLMTSLEWSLVCEDPTIHRIRLQFQRI